jgi:hypothetical protein
MVQILMQSHFESMLFAAARLAGPRQSWEIILIKLEGDSVA